MPRGCVKINCPIVNKISKGSMKNEFITKYNNKTIPNIIKNKSAFIIQKNDNNNPRKSKEFRKFIHTYWYLFLINS